MSRGSEDQIFQEEDPDWDSPLAPPVQAGLAVRVRNHVNPLSSRYSLPAEPPHWENVYPRLDQPFHLDIGTGSGRFLLAVARRYPDWNFLGVEIRRPLVERANLWRTELGLTNVHFLFANINITLPHLFAPGDLARVSIQFPDPWFKKRHQKRRVVQPGLVEELGRLLPSGAGVFLQSDIQAVALEMVERFTQHSDFHNPSGGGIDHNPLSIPTLRERQCLKLGLPIYRFWLVRR